MIDTINNINSLIFVDSNIWLYCFLTDFSILYSEDMQNGLIVSDMLTIVNPFQGN